MDVLWPAAIAADSVLRSISLRMQRQDQSNECWAIAAISFSERIYGDAFDFRFDEKSHLKVSPPRGDPAVIELRGIRAQLSSFVAWSGPAILVIGMGVVAGLWVARLLHLM
jgi:hypothetical protein